MRRHSQVDEIKAKAIVTATLDNNVTSICNFLKQYGPRLITSGNRRDLSLLKAAIDTLHLIETEREAIEEDLVTGYLFATSRQRTFTKSRP